MKYTTQELQEKINKLREQYKRSTGVDRKLIEIRGRILKNILANRGELL